MDKNLMARASIAINAPSTNVWNALVNPEAIKQYMFGVNFVSDSKEGSQIVWKGEWLGKSYEDKGVILQSGREEQSNTVISAHFLDYLIDPKAITL